MKYEINVRPHNERFHRFLVSEMIKKKDGLMTFIYRVDSGNIVDVVIMETKKNEPNTGSINLSRSTRERGD